MKKVMLAASVLALTVVGAPAYAQTLGGGTNTTGASGNRSDNDTVVVNDLIDFFVQDNAADSFQDNDQDNDGNGSFNGNTLIVASQSLSANNTNQYLDEVIDLDGVDEKQSDAGYHSGNNYVRGNAFAAYAGILNSAWNTGVNANTQAATNIAAQGTVTFGSDGGSGGSSGD